MKFKLKKIYNNIDKDIIIFIILFILGITVVRIIAIQPSANENYCSYIYGSEYKRMYSDIIEEVSCAKFDYLTEEILDRKPYPSRERIAEVLNGKYNCPTFWEVNRWGCREK